MLLHAAPQRTYIRLQLCTAVSVATSYGGRLEYAECWAACLKSGSRIFPTGLTDEPCQCLIATPILSCSLLALSMQSVCSPGLPCSHYIFIQQQPSLLSFQLPPQGAPVIQVINNNNNNAEAGWIELDYSVAEFGLDWLKAAHTPPVVILRASFSQCNVAPRSLKLIRPWGHCQHVTPSLPERPCSKALFEFTFLAWHIMRQENDRENILLLYSANRDVFSLVF